jgi:hypothetical protein
MVVNGMDADKKKGCNFLAILGRGDKPIPRSVDCCLSANAPSIVTAPNIRFKLHSQFGKIRD